MTLGVHRGLELIVGAASPSLPSWSGRGRQDRWTSSPRGLLHSPMATTGPSESWLLTRYRACGDTAAREELTRRMMPLVHRVAMAYGPRGHADDLEQVAALGLIKAIDRYDPRFGVPLPTYAIPTMFGEVRRYLRDHSWSMHVPRPLQERVMDISKATERLSAQSGRSPTPGELAAELGCSLEEVLEGLQASDAYHATSLQSPLYSADEPDVTVADVIGYEDERIGRAEQVASLRALRATLDDRERAVLYLRFVQDLTQTEIGRRIGISQMHVSRILRRSLRRLQDRLENAA
jgi:RNA polymerase sigma-B factor